MLSLIDVIGFVHTIYYQNVSLVSNSVRKSGIDSLKFGSQSAAVSLKAHILSISYRGRAVDVDTYH